MRNARTAQGPSGFGRSGASSQSSSKGMDLNHKITVDFVDACLGAKRRMAVAGKELEITIPEGIEDGQTLRLRGQGGGGGQFGAPRGDLLLEISIAQHAYFKRQGNDIHLDLPITLLEAIDGGKVLVPTLTGKVYLNVPAGSNTGKVLRLKGKGVKGGDQYVILRVTLPEPIDEDLKAAIRKSAENSTFDPREGM